ncbi:phenylacetate-CoA oxygenase, PaaG subunit [Caldalkalibacillus thermarum TA2.A1]|uniref:1,2-phenylacetyl-CoA epoxidase subunit A n=1 Tax=Caldalkalibacillus thermarum (strain TA2.A1) TaxID=986075 RepID=F5L514_CALTT|nr:1,2-phenylacetyl-CoA epoxidase subunit PaaA [Caldalkalibacillus thermarum]EGL83551.1 phenylacetate-CoA oxygenase, PaaG subunit [Caldalkalibacillus thermarum TA2.A1]QZT34487.1 1,2-phenylacetyl-CoA epoxidase subunit A [Caldalkalibacillus thermarum TA2.A1]
MVLPRPQVTINSDDPRVEAFLDRIDRGEKIEADDWMPDDYRYQLIKLISMHGISEIMGALPEKEWVPKAPTLKRKLSLMAKVQDEVGHGQLLLRVAEDLLRPLGKTREDILAELYAGRLKFHNVFHMPAPTWADAALIGWLVDGAAIITQRMLLSSSYAPYARALKRITAEERFHAFHGEDMAQKLGEGTPEQRRMMQEALNRWWDALLLFFGPPENQGIQSNQDINLRYKIRTKTNEQLRQEFLDKYVPQIQALGLEIPDEKLHFDHEEQKWVYTHPDYTYLKNVIAKNQGPRSQVRLALRRDAFENAAWVREALMARQNMAV